MASSRNAVHWHDHGFVFHSPYLGRHNTNRSKTKHVDALANPSRAFEKNLGKGFQGTSTVYRAPDYPSTGRFLINWNYFHPDWSTHQQTIAFGESYDLLLWTPIPQSEFEVDTRWYKPDRWDCIYTLPVQPRGRGSRAGGSADGYPRYGFWTATMWPNASGGGSFGFGVTDDGVHWSVRPSPRTEPPAGSTELGAVEYLEYEGADGRVHGRYYALLGDKHSRLERGLMDMKVYVARAAEGPYRASVRNPVLLHFARSCYFARFFWCANTCTHTHMRVKVLGMGMEHGHGHTDMMGCGVRAWGRSAEMEPLVAHQSFSHHSRTYAACVHGTPTCGLSLVL